MHSWAELSWAMNKWKKKWKKNKRKEISGNKWWLWKYHFMSKMNILDNSTTILPRHLTDMSWLSEGGWKPSHALSVFINIEDIQHEKKTFSSWEMFGFFYHSLFDAPTYIILFIHQTSMNMHAIFCEIFPYTHIAVSGCACAKIR